MPECEICGENNWSIVDSNWLRCKRCGRLETRMPERTCLICGKQVGKYAKPKTKICIVCKESSESTFESRLLCKTPACGNRLGKRADPSGYCRQCLYEIETCNTKDFHLWKSFALSVAIVPVDTIELLKQLQKRYPEMTRNKMFDWLIKQTKEGVLKRVGHGTYQANQEIEPRPLEEEGPSTLQIDPANSASWGPFRLTHTKKTS